MILEMDVDTPEQDVAALVAELERDVGLRAWTIVLRQRRFVLVSGDEALIPADLDERPGVHAHSTLERGYWLVDTRNSVLDAPVAVGAALVGDGSLWTAAGPCALERVEDAVETAAVVAAQGVDAIRIGLWKPRSGPYNFLGRGPRGLDDLATVRDAAPGVPIVSEVLDPRDVEDAVVQFDCLQIGTRNMTNQALLMEVGRTDRPVLLKRGSRSTVDEWLRAAEFVVSQGNERVILCARGIVSFDTSLRHQPDLGAVLAVRQQTRLPVVFDPSHATGRLDAVARIALAAAAVGVDGLIVESHIRPDRMYRPGDFAHAYPPSGLETLFERCRIVRELATELDAVGAA